jgi:hypothetical protein
MRVRKPFVNHADRTASFADQHADRKRRNSFRMVESPESLAKRKALVGKGPVGLLAEVAWVGEVPVEIRLGPIRLRFHARILPPWPESNIRS